MQFLYLTGSPVKVRHFSFFNSKVFLIVPELWRFYFCLHYRNAMPADKKSEELKTALRIKSLEWDAAMEMGKPYREQLKIYKEIKELQYKLVVAQIAEQGGGQDQQTGEFKV
jgi:hypothetical protein